MNVVIFQIGGHGTAGDVMIVVANSKGGGQSNARYVCKGEKIEAYIDEEGEPRKRTIAADTPDDMASGLADAINASGEFAHDAVQAAAKKGGLLTLGCSEVYYGTTWSVEVQGKGTETVEGI
jgi:hypothetical protein